MAFTAMVCPITRQEFLEHARSINQKSDVTINGKKVKVQVGLNITIVGSKELP